MNLIEKHNDTITTTTVHVRALIEAVRLNEGLEEKAMIRRMGVRPGQWKMYMVERPATLEWVCAVAAAFEVDLAQVLDPKSQFARKVERETAKRLAPAKAPRKAAQPKVATTKVTRRKTTKPAEVEALPLEV